jgi:enamine deaminase RidA (YjgF/YER057c/UK114 family)
MTAIRRWPSGAAGRSRTVAAGGFAWTVANATDPSAGFEAQVRESLRMLDSHLEEAGSSRGSLVSVQVLLANIGDRPAFDALWVDWIGPDPAHWPQRACFQAALAPGLLVEIIAVAETSSSGESPGA